MKRLMLFMLLFVSCSCSAGCVYQCHGDECPTGQVKCPNGNCVADLSQCGEIS